MALLTVFQVAEHVQLSPEAVRRAARRGDLSAYRVGGRLRFTAGAVDAWLEASASACASDEVSESRSSDSLPRSRRGSSVRDRMKQNRKRAA